jgi:hypothetical protein
MLARTLVAFGLVAGATHLGMNETLHNLTVFDMEWQSWAPRLLSVCFGLVLMLALLAFMDSRTTAGCNVWGGLVLCFYATSSGLALLRATWPKGSTELDLSLVPAEITLSWLCGPLFIAAFCLSLAQILAATLARAVASMPPRRMAQRPT